MAKQTKTKKLYVRACVDTNPHAMTFEDDTCFRCGFVWPKGVMRQWNDDFVWVMGYPTEESEKREQHYNTYRRRVRVKFPPKSLHIGNQREL